MLEIYSICSKGTLAFGKLSRCGFFNYKGVLSKLTAKLGEDSILTKMFFKWVAQPAPSCVLFLFRTGQFFKSGQTTAKRQKQRPTSLKKKWIEEGKSVKHDPK